MDSPNFDEHVDPDWSQEDQKWSPRESQNSLDWTSFCSFEIAERPEAVSGTLTDRSKQAFEERSRGV